MYPYNDLKKEYARFVLQNILGMLGISVYILADTFYISKSAGADGITVLNLCLPLYNFIYAIGSMVGVGAATRYTIEKAQGNQVCDYFFSNAIFWVCLAGAPFVLLGLCGSDWILHVMGGDAGIVSLGKPYAQIFLLFAPFFMLNYVMNAFVRNDGSPSLAMAATIAGSLFNIVFDYIFMFPMHMGMAGAALATAISPIVSSSVCAVHFFQKKNNLRFVWRKPSWHRLVQSCQLGTSAFIGEFSSAVTTTTFNILILRITGNVGVAAYGVIANLALVCMAMCNGIAQGSQPLISRYYGRGEKSAVQKLLGYGLCSAAGLAALIVLAAWAGTEGLIGIFNSEASEQLFSLAFHGMHLYFLGFLFAGVNIVIAGYLSATNCALQALAVSLSRGIVMIVLCAVVLSGLFGMTGIWLSFPTAEALTTVMILGGYGIRSGRRAD